MTKEELRKACFIGLSEDIDGEFYPIYDFDKLWDLIHTIDEKEVDELAHKHCMSLGYNNLNEKDYIPIGSMQWGDVIFDIEDAYKAGYHRVTD